LKALPPKKEESKEAAEAEIKKSIDNTLKKSSLVQSKNAPIEKIEIVPTKQEVVYEVFNHAHEARKQQVSKNSTSKLLTDKEIGFVGQGTVPGGPESLN
jgi:hypothetical protein